MGRLKHALALLCLMLGLFHPIASEAKDGTPLPRTVYTFYDADNERIPRYSLVHRVLEMPLNWLGYHLEYIERRADLPEWRDDVAGVVLWLPPGVSVGDMDAFCDWLDAGLNAGKKLVIMGNPGFDDKWRDTEEGFRRVSAIFKRIGVKETDSWVGLTYNTRVEVLDPLMVEFERQYEGVLPGYYHVQALHGTQVHLQAHNTLDDGAPLTTQLVMTHPNGGYIADGYGFFYTLKPEDDSILAQRWLVDPFRFLSAALGAEHSPRPDVSTLGGRRIYYSHLDGDGWNNFTEVSRYIEDRATAAKVLYEEVYTHYPALPFTVAPIVSELDPTCYGRAESEGIARDIFALPNVEPSSHTYSHPLMWQYFEHYHPQQEKAYFSQYPDSPNQKTSIYDAVSTLWKSSTFMRPSWQAVAWEDTTIPPNPFDSVVKKHFGIPRSYACDPFDMQTEIVGSVEYLQTLVPADKRIRMIQWSGDTTPGEKALTVTRKARLLNINGGDSRFDPEYPSYSYVAPLGLKVGDERQIYSSNSNENTYTALWSERFFAFRHLVNTVRNTESPRRISPFNIYYHTYSAEKEASLNALKRNIDYALTQEIIPLYASEYAEIAEGFFSAQFTPLGTQRWQVTNRGALGTIRFDHASELAVDWERSEGVIGQRHYQGSLYVALDPQSDAPVIALQPHTTLTYPANAPHPYLIESNWRISKFTSNKDGSTKMRLGGFGDGTVTLFWPDSNPVQLTAARDKLVLHSQVLNANSDHELTFIIKNEGGIPQPVDVSIAPATSVTQAEAEPGT